MTMQSDRFIDLLLIFVTTILKSIVAGIDNTILSYGNS